MNISPVAQPAGAFTVTPVVDYEPPTKAAPRVVPACRPAARAASRRGGQAPHRPHAPQPAAGPPIALSAPMRQAASFADAALRRVLEVLDRRRPAAQLAPLLAPSLVDSVVAISAAGHAARGEGAAVLRRMRLQPAGHRNPDSAAEVFGSYSRGHRVHAIACRVERVTAGARWMVVALHIG
ncbi:hypothetical protein A5714_13000 [Mycobacterium sp. E2462]|uniref:Rv3235 family protein n=1 Tax=Mycobacterium sp. E2462 TaxID=1834133 RepID=UPI0007FBFEEF|nr:Rv3235 family protein [Mycobacterium sp. E2462]OBI14844.1 hypothetical protein A5714_13000 [Mycobacterium sp. E2462]